MRPVKRLHKGSATGRFPAHRGGYPAMRAIALILTLVLGGCVYFNTFYNAKQHFKKAERENRPAPGQRRGVSTTKRLYEDAIAKAQKIAEKHPDSKYHDDALFMIGVSYFRMGDYVKSERRFRELLASHPESELIEESQLYLARCRMELGDEQAAFRTFSELAQTARKKEWRAEATYQRAEFFADNGAHDSAVAAYTLILEEYPNSDRALEARLWAAEQLRFLERPAEAITLYEPLIDDDDLSISYEALLGTAESWYEAEEYDSGIAIMQMMAEQDEYYDSIGTIRLVLGKGLESQGNKAVAWRQYEQVAAALENTEWSAVAYFRMAEIRQFEEGDLISAKELYDASRRENSRGELANLALARSAYIAKLAEFRKELGRGELVSETRVRATGRYDPENLPRIEREAAYSPLAARPQVSVAGADSLNQALAFAPAGGLLPDGRPVYGPPTPSEDEESEEPDVDTALEVTTVAQEEFGPPIDLAPTLGPPIDQHAIEFNRIRDELLPVPMWWSLIGHDSLLGPATPGYLYPFGSGGLLGPTTPPDSVLKVWADLEANTPARIERERRAEERARRRETYADIETSAKMQLQLAELYRFNLGYPDSAIREYSDMADRYAETPFGARALLGAADVYREDLSDTAAADQRLRRILTEYPYTDYAGDAIRKLGWQGTNADTAHPAWAYAQAERAFLEADDPRQAVERLKAFIERYPQSRLVPTAEYAIVALTDRYFPPGDSAVIWAYEEIVAEYPMTDIATAAQERLKTTIQRPQRRRPPPPTQAEPQLAEADTLADTTQVQDRLPMAPKPKAIGMFVYPQSEVGSDLGEHVIVYKILIDFSGDIAAYEVLQPSPSFDVNEAAKVALEPTRFWSDSIPPDSLNIWYRYEMTITPPARDYDEFDRLGIDPHDPRKSGNP